MYYVHSVSNLHIFIFFRNKFGWSLYSVFACDSFFEIEEEILNENFNFFSETGDNCHDLCQDVWFKVTLFNIMII